MSLTALAASVGLATAALAAAPVATPGRPYTGRAVCCKDPAEFSYAALPDRGRVEFDIDRKSPLFEFQTGFSAFSAFRLPVMNEPYLIEIRSYLRGGPDPGSVEPGAQRVRPAFGIELEKAADDFNVRAVRLRRRALRIGLVLAVVALPLAVVAGRRQIIQALPALRPAYAALCQPLRCQVPLPADADAWSVESNELLEDPNVPQLFHFAATLRNRSAYTQAFPTLDLSLTDMEGLAVDRRVVPAQQYLPPGRPVAEGLAPNAEVALHVDVKAADRRSQGYRVVLFFP